METSNKAFSGFPKTQLRYIFEVVGFCSARLNIIESFIFKMCQELPLLKKLPTIQLVIGVINHP